MDVSTVSSTKRAEPTKRLAIDERRLAWIALVAIGLAEVVTTYIDPLWGLMFHSILLGMFVTWAAIGASRASRALGMSLALGPLIRMLSLGMPLGDYPQMAWYALSAVPMFAGAIAVAKLAELPFAEIGLRLPAKKDLPLEAIVIVSGVVFGVMEYLILRPDPLAEGDGLPELVLAGFILWIGTGVMEEFVFRGVLQRTAQELFPRLTAIAFVSLLFGVLHIGHRSVIDLVFVTLVAIYFAFVVGRTRSILGVSISHGITNILLFIVMPRLLG